MEPLNKEERTKAFLMFILIFIVTVGIAVGAVFFNIEVPRKENSRLKERNAALQASLNGYEQLLAKAETISGKFEELADETKFNYTEGMINSEIVALRDMKYFGDVDKKLGEKISQAYLGWLADKKKANDAAKASTGVEGYKADLQLCDAERTRLEDKVDQLRNDLERCQKSFD